MSWTHKRLVPAIAVAALSLFLPGTVRAADPAATSSREVLLGVLEEFAFEPGSVALRAQLRMGFRRTAAGWVALPDGVGKDDDYDKAEYVAAGQALRRQLPRELDVTACFDGKPRGRATGTLPERWGPRARGSYCVAPEQKLPWAGRRQPEFAGWQRVPIHRPLVVTTSGQCGDPDGWKRVPFERVELDGLMPRLRAALRRAKSPLAAADAKMFLPRKAYRSRSGDRLLSVGFSNEWFLVRLPASGEVEWLGDGLTVIDAGDFDGDGRSEVVVMAEAGQTDGLLLFSDSFRSRVSFSWMWAPGPD